jgi:acyl-CoA dehydrogenase
MNFTYTPAQQAFATELGEALSRFDHSATIRSQADAGVAAFDAALWQALADQRWLGTAVSADLGGRGLGAEELTLVAYEAGRALSPAPLVATLLAGEALKAAGATQYVRDLAAGRLRVALCLPPPGASQPVMAVRDGQASGVLTPVADGMVADAVLCADADGRCWLVDLRNAGVRRRQLVTLDLAHTSAELTLEKSPALLLGALDTWRACAAILVAFEQLGGAQRCLDSAVAYAKERYAFGQPIGAFQSLKHKLAALHVEVELARANAYYGAFVLAGGDAELENLTAAASLARASATETYLTAAQESLHVHGGVGFTWDCDMQLHLRRARAMEAALGSATAWCAGLLDDQALLASF